VITSCIYVATRIIEIAPEGMIDRVMGFEEYLETG
jgi:hypothetical protein